MIETSIGLYNNYLIIMCDDMSDIQEAHKQQIYTILSDAFHRTLGHQYLAAMATTIAFQKGVYYLYVLEDDVVMGYCNVAIGTATTGGLGSTGGTSHDSVVFISNVATSVQHRKKGIATMLVQRVLDRFSKDNIKLQIDNNDDVVWKHKFYQKLGFEKIKFEVLENRYCMQYTK